MLPSDWWRAFAFLTSKEEQVEGVGAGCAHGTACHSKKLNVTDIYLFIFLPRMTDRTLSKSVGYLVASWLIFNVFHNFPSRAMTFLFMVNHNMFMNFQLYTRFGLNNWMNNQSALLNSQTVNNV